MPKHLGFDPGKTTGYAVTNETGKLLDIGQLSPKELFDFLQSLNDVAVFVVEDFLIRPDKRDSFIWSDMETVRIIGALEYAAYTLNARVVKQAPSIKSIGYKWGGIVKPKSHEISHQYDAYAHLVYFNCKELKLPIPALKIMKASRNAVDIVEPYAPSKGAL